MNWNWRQHIRHRFKGWRWGGVKILLVIVLLGLTVRSLPYLAPIRAADIAQDDQAITFRDRHGALLGTLLTRDQEHTAVVPLEQISSHFLHAIVAAEDKRFYRHGALDGWAIGRAIAEAIQARQIVSGASTITMQLARMLEPNPRTFWSKIQEIWLSWRLFAGMSRDEILQAYINRLPMGSNIYGIEAAAQVYFGVPASDLTLAQASLLAGIPNDPNNLNPYTSAVVLRRRQGYVLARMVEDGYITQAQADRAAQTATPLQSRQEGIGAAPHYLFWLASQLPPDHLPQIRTTIDLPLQQFVEAQVQQVVRSLTAHNVRHAAALVLDNQSGDVLAYVGSPDYFADTQLGRNDGVQALRQPGSTLKPFLYELALEKRVIRPNTILADVPTYYAIPGARLYRPTDYSETFQGPVRVRIALANSLNIPAVRVLEKLGVSPFLERLHQLGFEHLTEPAEHYGLGLTLGSGEVTLWELAHAYRRMANQNSGEDVGEGSDSSIVPLTRYSKDAEATWALITDMLSDRHARARSFGVDSVLNLPFPAAVKTGTSSDFRDTWTVGFTTDYTVATWVGNFNGEPMQNISGVTGAAPLWNRILLHLHEQREPAPFSPPSGLVQRPICAVSGARPTSACPTTVQEYFYPEDLYAYEHEADPFYGATTNQNQARLRLPPEYNEWLSTQQQTSLNPDQLRLLVPQNGDYFAMGSPAPNPKPRLEFKVAGRQNQPVEWWLNGEKLATQASDSLFWTLQPGVWTLQVKSGEMTDQVRFEVEVAEPSHNPQRGFSVVGQ